MSKRMTKQKNLIYEALMNLNHPTAEEIYDYLQKKDSKIGVATIYRNLQAMHDDGLILKLDLDSKASRYDYQEKAHSHFKCKSCNKVYDLIDQTHNLKDFDVEEIIYFGKCESCR